MELLDLRFIGFNGPLVNFKTKQYIFLKIYDFIVGDEDTFRDFVVIDEHLADIVMRCNSHGIKTYYCCSGHPMNKYMIEYTDPCYSAYIAFEQKPIIKGLFEESEYWNVEDDFVSLERKPSYILRLKKKHQNFNDWCKAMEELKYKFSFLTNEFQQIRKI